MNQRIVRTPNDRLDEWAAFASDARSHAAAPDLEPTARFVHRAEGARVWAWPEAGALRCRALQQVAVLFATARPGEREVLAGPMADLAESVLCCVAAHRPDPIEVEDGPARPERKDIYG